MAQRICRVSDNGTSIADWIVRSRFNGNWTTIKVRVVQSQIKTERWNILLRAVDVTQEEHLIVVYFRRFYIL